VSIILTKKIRAELGRQLRALTQLRVVDEDVTFTNADAASYMAVSERTLKRMSFPSDPDGPVPVRYIKNGNLYWSKHELDAYKLRRQLFTETSLRSHYNSRSLLTDLMEN